MIQDPKTMKRYLVFPLLFVFFTLSLTACGLFSSDKSRQEKPAEELLNTGRTAFGKEKYRDAIDAFQQLKNWYPFSQYVAEASLAIADSHYALKEYPEAAAVYTEFERLHPTNPEAARAAFSLAMCHYKQIKTTDRDQIPTRQAIAAFTRVIETYPLSSYSSESREKIVECREKLAQSELTVARYYYRTKSYEAAQKRLEHIIQEYPDTSRAGIAEGLLENVTAVIAGKKAGSFDIPEEEKKTEDEEKPSFMKRMWNKVF